MLINIIWKSLVAYFVVLIALKFMGKREVGQLSLLDFAIILIIADILVIGIESTDEPFYYYIAPIVLLSVVQKVFAYILMKFPKLRGIFDGKQSVIVYDGKLNIKEMKRQNYNVDDLLMQLRLQGISSLSEVRYVVLETNGKLSVFEYEKNPSAPFPVVISGEINKDNLQLLGLSEEWIIKRLKGHQLKDVMYAIYEDQDLFIMSHTKEEQSN